MNFNPTAIDITTLPWMPLDETLMLPRRACIYFAIDSTNTVLYIGRSINVRRRWSRHQKYEVLSRIGGVKIACRFVEAPELLPDIETALIKHFDPPLNVVGRVKSKKPKEPPKEIVTLSDCIQIFLSMIEKSKNCVKQTTIYDAK